MIRLGILGSTRGSLLLPILDAIHKKNLDAEIAAVVSNKEHALILEKARMHNLPAFFVNPHNLSRENYDDLLSALFKKFNVQLIILIGYLRILSQPFVETWPNRILNIHPSLLPEFSGLMDLAVHRAVILSGKKETGCTVHFVTKELDAGPIILQKKCDVVNDDTAESLKQRVQHLESQALIEAIAIVLQNQHAIN